jgi:hypothetical protein
MKLHAFGLSTERRSRWSDTEVAGQYRAYASNTPSIIEPMKVQVGIECGAEAVDKDHGPKANGGRRTRTLGLEPLLDACRKIRNTGPMSAGSWWRKIAQAFGQRQYPLTYRHLRKHLVHSQEPAWP